MYELDVQDRDQIAGMLNMSMRLTSRMVISASYSSGSPYRKPFSGPVINVTELTPGRSFKAATYG